MNETILALILLSTSTVFGYQDFGQPNLALINDIKSGFGQDGQVVLAGKNIVSGNACYLKFSDYFFSQTSVDTSGMSQELTVRAQYQEEIRDNSAHRVEIFTHELTPAALGLRTTGVFEKNGSTLKVSIVEKNGMSSKKTQKVVCEYNLKNQTTQPVACETDIKIETVANCNFVVNLGNPKLDLTGGHFGLQKVSAVTCDTGVQKIIFQGYQTENSEFSYADPRNIDPSHRFWKGMGIQLQPWSVRKNTKTQYTMRTEYSGEPNPQHEMTFDKSRKEIEMKYYESGLLGPRKIFDAKYKCH